MSVVTSKRYVKDGVKEEKVTWHNVVLFNKLSEIAEKYISIGDMVWIQGEMETKKYMNQHGQEKQSFKIIANDVRLFPKGKQDTATPASKDFQAPEDDEVPW
jgi:single-strand DNA-binding protein